MRTRWWFSPPTSGPCFHGPYTPADRHLDDYPDVTTPRIADIYPPRPGKPEYANIMENWVAGPDGEQVAVEMGSYGIGVSRLVGGIIEASHDDDGPSPRVAKVPESGVHGLEHAPGQIHTLGRR